MKIIVAGGRDFDDWDLLVKTLSDEVKQGDIIISGEARGADTMGASFAERRPGIYLRRMPADWDRHGKSAGYRRNEAMAEVADKLVAFWDGQSRGTKHMIDLMKKLGKPVVIIKYERRVQ